MSKTFKTQQLMAATNAMIRGSGLAQSANPRVTRALRAADASRVSSVPGIVQAFTEKRAAIVADKDLSDSGKQARIRAAAGNALANIGAGAKAIAALEREHAQARASAVRLEKPDAAEMMLDLAIAAHIRETAPIPSVLERQSERVRVALARVPSELSGIKPEVQARVLGSLVDAETAAQLAEEVQALEIARQVTQAGIDDLASEAQLQPRELVQAFGTDWRLPGLVDSLTQRLAREIEAEQAEETGEEVTSEGGANGNE